MRDTNAHTESLLDVVKGIDTKAIMLPESVAELR